MPKIKPSPTRAKAETVQANIRSRCALFGCISEVQIAKRLGLTKSTYHNRASDPLGWGLDELIRAADVLKVPLEWLMTDHRELRG